MLKIFKDNSDVSLELESYVQDYSLGVLADDEFIYVGYKKPINALYAHMTTPNTSSGTLSVEYFNGSDFTPVADLVERTKGLTENNFIEWSRNQDDEEMTTINSLEMFWIRISIDVSTSALTFRALNLLFSSDNELKEEADYLLSSNYYHGSETSYVNYHQASRNQIIQRLRNQGYSVNNKSSGHHDLTIFDLLSFKQLQEASKFMVLGKIFFFLSDAVEDKYYQKYQDYKRLSNEAFNTFFLSIDKNDDGVEDKHEKAGFKTGLIKRV